MSNSLTAMEALISTKGDMDLAAIRVSGGDKETFARMLLGGTLGDLQDAARMIIIAHLCQVIEAYSFHAIRAVDELEPVQIARQLRSFLDSAYMFTHNAEVSGAEDGSAQLRAFHAAFEQRRLGAPAGNN